LCLNSDYNPIKTDHHTRKNTLEHILSFYSRHVENFGELNSVKILQEVFS